MGIIFQNSDGNFYFECLSDGISLCEYKKLVEKCEIEKIKNNLNEFYKFEVIKHTYCDCTLCNFRNKNIKNIGIEDILKIGTYTTAIPSYNNPPPPPKRPEPPQLRWQRE